ncbi:MAG: pseudouridine-5'-phosphate glycosidase, partial [Candidatus Dormibacteraeota bacterium]|nr:pseudouridine-5'-phosphate glycosidase [Candidatus Dormibacteraeota bacterium]
SPVAVFCAGAKTVLDIPRTLEALESYSIPVLGYGTGHMPGFYLTTTGLPVSGRVDGPEQTALALRAGWAAGLQGMVIAIPPPGELAGVGAMVEQAVLEAGDISGPGLTPRLLAAIGELSNGRSTQLNVELVINNAGVAAAVAVAFARG